MHDFYRHRDSVRYQTEPEPFKVNAEDHSTCPRVFVSLSFQFLQAPVPYSMLICFPKL